MTLMDAPKFDAIGARRNSLIAYGFTTGVVIALIVAWLLAGRPLAGPWSWWTYWAGGRATDQFLHAVESNDMPKAYALWVHDPDWQQHAANYKTYPFERFEEDWGPDSSANEYGAIKSHNIVVKKIVGTELVVGSMINGRKSKPLFLAYDRNTHTLGFSPVELTLDE